jgi:hypothetical protein
MSFDERPQDRPPTRQYGYPHEADSYQPEPTTYQLQPGYYDQLPAYGVARDNSNATLALVLGLVGLFAGILIVSPIAWWKGTEALAEIDAAPGVYNNRGMALAGQITGIIGTALLGLAILFGAAMVVFLITFSQA